MKISIAIVLTLASALPIGAANAHPVLSPNEGSMQIDELAKKAPGEFDRRLQDYPSARFREVTGHYVDHIADRVFYLCGYVNSKNGFGGYGGWRMFIFMDGLEPPYTPELTLSDMGDRFGATTFEDLCVKGDEQPKGRKLKDYSGLLTYRQAHASNKRD